MYIHNLNPTLLNLGQLEIRWYGLVYVLGFLLAVWWLQKNKKEIGLSKDDTWDLLFYIMVGIIAGARLFEVFWEPGYYLANPVNFVKVWQGGMSFHGGFVGIVVAVWWYSRKKNVHFWKVADVLSIPAIFGLALGRIANFINGELWGRAFDGSWCVNFKNTGGGDICRHPSTLYAALKRFVVFSWLVYLRKKAASFTPGFIFWNFVFWEGLGRFIVDFYRKDILWAGFTIGQWFSLIMVSIAVVIFIQRYREDWQKIWSA